MVTIEEEAIKLFEQGKKPEEVLDILSEKGIKASESTIKTYNRLWRNGYEGQSAYLKDLARKKGSESWYEHQGKLVRERGFKNYPEYYSYIIKDSNFREIYYSNGSDGINENNPYILMLKFLEMKAASKDITETNEYKKLKEILKNMKPKERLTYIEKLERGVEILIKLGKIDYGNVSLLYSV